MSISGQMSSGAGAGMGLAEMIASAGTNPAVQERRARLKAEKKRKGPATGEEEDFF